MDLTAAPEDLLPFYVEASTIAMSSDGNFLAIGDQYDNVKLLSTADISVLYQLVSQDPVLGLAFSVDNNQIYDIRTTYGDIWKPNILLKLSRPAVQFSDGESHTNQQVVGLESKFSELLSISVDPITALGSQKSGRLHCSGTRRRVICLFDTSRGMICELNRSANFFSIQKIVWSNNKQYVCYADVSRTIFVDSVIYDSGSGTATIKRVLELPIKYLKENIDDVFFHPDLLTLLVCSNSAVAVISVNQQAIVATQEHEDICGEWINHPGNKKHILYIGPSRSQCLHGPLLRKWGHCLWPLKVGSTSKFTTMSKGTSPWSHTCIIRRALLPTPNLLLMV